MEKIDRAEKKDTQKAKIIFLSLAALVAILLVWSVVSMNKARSERDTARQEAEMLRQDNAKLEQMAKDLSQENAVLKKKIEQLQVKPKAKPAAKKKTKTATKSSSSKKAAK